jgi:membrane protein YdbS with pleckstrin-like domain
LNAAQRIDIANSTMNECETNDLSESTPTTSVEQPISTDQMAPLEQQVVPLQQAMPAQQLPGVQQISFEQLHPDSIVVERWAGLIFVAVLGFIALVVWVTLTFFVFPIWDFRCWLIGLSCVALLGLLGAFVRMDPVWKFRNTRLRELPGGLELQRGYVWWHRIFVPRERIQHTDVVQGPLMRRFNLATLVINTAGTHEHSISIEGLDFQRAEQLRASLLIKNLNPPIPLQPQGPNESVVDVVTSDGGG